MSEYMRRQPTPQEVWDRTDHSGTLFDQTATPATGNEPELKPGASVDVRKRYLALEAISDTIGYINQTRGFEKVHTRSDIKDRYPKPGRIADAMKLKSKAEMRRFRDSVATLTAADALLAAGFDDADVDLNSIATKHEILKDFGPTTTYEDRTKKLKRVNKGL